MTTTEQTAEQRIWDVAIVGAGNAGLCAAITAAEAGASVLVLEMAPKTMRGGNTRHTRNLRARHEAPTDVLSDRYTQEEYWDDLMRVTKGVTNRDLAALTLDKSAELTDWMQAHGVTFQPALSGTLNLGRTNAFFLGGGRALLNSLCKHAEGLGVVFQYDCAVEAVEMEDGFCLGLQTSQGPVRFKQLITTAGGFEANLDWLAEGWGEAAKNFLVRGTPYNTGSVLKSLLDNGTQRVGDVDQCHAVAIDARAPKFDGGIASRLDAVPFSVVLNNQGKRFYDEGEDFWPKRYAIWGRLVAGQPDQIAYAIVDSDGNDRFMPSLFDPILADSIEALAEKLGLDPAAASQAVAEFNAACPPGEIDPSILDGQGTKGLTPEKTNWAASIAKPPFYGYPLRPGITFTYMGVAVDEQARVLMDDGRPCANLFAAGEIMAGNILGQGYLAGIGMTIGAVFGRIAGEQAAKALNL